MPTLELAAYEAEAVVAERCLSASCSDPLSPVDRRMRSAGTRAHGRCEPHLPPLDPALGPVASHADGGDGNDAGAPK
jgi:hypothetical protein